MLVPRLAWLTPVTRWHATRSGITGLGQVRITGVCFYSLVCIEHKVRKKKGMAGVQAPNIRESSIGKVRALNTHLLPPPGAVGACTVSVKQPHYLEVDYTHKAVTIECTFSTTGCPSEQPMSLWFRYGAHQPENLCFDGCRSETDKFTVGEALAQNRVSLTVNRVTSNDSAIYFCGIAFPSVLTPRARQTGGGTTLVVRGQSMKAFCPCVNTFCSDLQNLHIISMQKL